MPSKRPLLSKARDLKLLLDLPSNYPIMEMMRSALILLTFMLLMPCAFALRPLSAEQRDMAVFVDQVSQAKLASAIDDKEILAVTKRIKDFLSTTEGYENSDEIKNLKRKLSKLKNYFFLKEKFAKCLDSENNPLKLGDKVLRSFLNSPYSPPPDVDCRFWNEALGNTTPQTLARDTNQILARIRTQTRNMQVAATDGPQAMENLKTAAAELVDRNARNATKTYLDLLLRFGDSSLGNNLTDAQVLEKVNNDLLRRQGPGNVETPEFRHKVNQYAQEYLKEHRQKRGRPFQNCASPAEPNSYSCSYQQVANEYNKVIKKVQDAYMSRARSYNGAWGAGSGETRARVMKEVMRDVNKELAPLMRSSMGGFGFTNILKDKIQNLLDNKEHFSIRGNCTTDQCLSNYFKRVTAQEIKSARDEGLLQVKNFMKGPESSARNSTFNLTEASTTSQHFNRIPKTKEQLESHLKDLVTAGPAAVGEFLIKRPTYGKLVCDMIAKVEADEKQQRNVRKVAMWGGVIVGGAAMLTGVGAAVTGGIAASALGSAAVGLGTLGTVMSGGEFFYGAFHVDPMLRQRLRLQTANIPEADRRIDEFLRIQETRTAIRENRRDTAIAGVMTAGDLGAAAVGELARGRRVAQTAEASSAVRTADNVRPVPSPTRVETPSPVSAVENLPPTRIIDDVPSIRAVDNIPNLPAIEANLLSKNIDELNNINLARINPPSLRAELESQIAALRREVSSIDCAGSACLELAEQLRRRSSSLLGEVRVKSGLQETAEQTGSIVITRDVNFNAIQEADVTKGMDIKIKSSENEFYEGRIPSNLHDSKNYRTFQETQNAAGVAADSPQYAANYRTWLRQELKKMEELGYQWKPLTRNGETAFRTPEGSLVYAQTQCSRCKKVMVLADGDGRFVSADIDLYAVGSTNHGSVISSNRIGTISEQEQAVMNTFNERFGNRAINHGPHIREEARLGVESAGQTFHAFVPSNMPNPGYHKFTSKAELDAFIARYPEINFK